MRRWIFWALYVGAIATLVYVVSLSAVPYGVMKLIHTRTAERTPINSMLHAERPSDTSRTVVRPSPDLLYSLCWYDLSSGPIRVVTGAPQDTYWSAAAYQSNTDNYFVVNDRTTNGQQADMVVFSADQVEPALKPGQIGVKSPSISGLILIRTLVADEARSPEIDGMRRQAACGPLTP